jgi:hypothetical protein
MAIKRSKLTSEDKRSLKEKAEFFGKNFLETLVEYRAIDPDVDRQIVFEGWVMQKLASFLHVLEKQVGKSI